MHVAVVLLMLLHLEALVMMVVRSGQDRSCETNTETHKGGQQPAAVYYCPLRKSRDRREVNSVSCMRKPARRRFSCSHSQSCLITNVSGDLPDILRRLLD
ncbi:hypothetical protein ILYODFUR_000767 [Ilyodon furcidens]|uniref:Secreted protein n=1 Tax=Ilyodon furcidens TaxID=33524 RepID=A0ABV0SU38_9TELE